MAQPPAPKTSNGPARGPGGLLRCGVVGEFAAWISNAGGSLAITTYQAGKVVLAGWDGRQVSVLPRDFDRPMGLAIDGPRLALATRHQVVLLSDARVLAGSFPGAPTGRYDALYLPRQAYFTGELNVHDVALGPDGPILVNTLFSCLARLDPDHSFRPIWRPPFVSALEPEDRCHLNGLAMDEGRPRFVTALGTTDEAGGWRSRKLDGGVVLDIGSGQVVLSGLCMPHSPRIRNGALWLLNSGRGELLRSDPPGAPPEVVCTLPGYLRGLDFAGDFALVGLSQVRQRHLFAGLPVQESHPALRCGVAAVDLRSGVCAGMLEFTEGCTELYDVRFLPGVSRPMIVGPEKEATRQAIVAPGSSCWIRTESADAPPTVTLS
ncbi:MAG: TIGR03032 family protein [Isosphaeraceae bacterium]